MTTTLGLSLRAQLGAARAGTRATNLGLPNKTGPTTPHGPSGTGTAIKIYVNGALKVTSTGKGGATALATENLEYFSLGCNPLRNGYFNGNFDELRIWSTARSDAEIAESYDTSVATDSPALVGYWKFDVEDADGNSPDAVTTPGHTPHPATPIASGALEDLPTVAVSPHRSTCCTARFHQAPFCETTRSTTSDYVKAHPERLRLGKCCQGEAR